MALCEKLRDHQHDNSSTWGEHDCVSISSYVEPFSSCHKTFLKTKSINLMVALEDHQR